MNGRIWSLVIAGAGVLLLGLSVPAQAGPVLMTAGGEPGPGGNGGGGGGGVSLRTTIWADGGESDNFSAWTIYDPESQWTVVTSTSAARTGSRGIDIIGPTGPGGDVLGLEIPTSGYYELELEYWWKVRNALELADLVLIQWTPDNGATWITLDTHNNKPAGEWVRFVAELPDEADDNADFGLRLIAELGSTADRMAFDDFALTGKVVPEPATLTMLGLGGLVAVRKRRNK